MSKKKPEDYCKVCHRPFKDDGTGVCPACRRSLPDERQVLQASARQQDEPEEWVLDLVVSVFQG